MAKKIMAPLLKTPEQIEACVGEIARITATLKGVEAELETNIVQIRAQYEERVSELTADLKIELAMAERWAMEHKADWGERKSVELLHGTLGFRTGMPRMKFARGVTEEVVIDRLFDFGLLSYIREKRELNRDTIIADREKLNGTMEKLGVFIEQSDRFFVEPKQDSLPSGI